jgi:hypothetical protein
MGERRITSSTRTATGDELSGESTGPTLEGAEQARTGAGSTRPSAHPAHDEEPSTPTGRGVGGFVTVEEWTPPSVGRAAERAREYLADGESLEFAEAATHVDGSVRPAAVGLTGDRLLVVSDEGFVGLGLDRVCAVRSDRRTAYGLRGSDYRLVLTVGFLLATVGFVGVLGTAANPLTPTAALATLGGAFFVDHVRRNGADLDPVVAAVSRRDRDRGARLHRLKRRINESASDDHLMLAVAGTLALVPFALVVAFEAGVATPALALLAVAGVGLAVSAFRHSDAFDGIEVVRRHQRTVRVTVEDGGAVVVRTHPESAFDSELAGLAQGRTGAA